MGQIDQCIFGSVILVARTRWKKREENSVDILAKFACGQVWSPRLYRLTHLYVPARQGIQSDRLSAPGCPGSVGSV